MLYARMTPACLNAASTMASEDAMAPVWDEAARAPAQLRPTFMATTGLMRVSVARRVQELPPVAHTLQVEDDQVRLRVTPQVVEEIHFVDIGHVAEGHELREPHADAPRPVEDRRRDGAGLRDERHREAQRLCGGERRVERGGGIDDADGVGADEANAHRGGRVRRCRARAAVLRRPAPEIPR